MALIQIIGSIWYRKMLITMSKDILTIDLKNYKQNKIKINSAIKRSIEILATAALIILIAPTFILITIIIKIESPGPSMVKAKRKGKYGKEIYIYKFRVFKKIMPENESNFPLKDDFRYTNFGKFLIRTGLAYLPELFNILKGDISFVGRSQVLDFEDTKKNVPKEIYNELLKIKPGIASLYSISEDAVEFQKDHILNYDIYYLLNRSLWLDLKILLSAFVKTAGIVAEYNNEKD